MSMVAIRVALVTSEEPLPGSWKGSYLFALRSEV